jgi:protein O-GlcNAc transferase
MRAIADIFAAAVRQQQAGNLADAVALVQQILQDQPQHAKALNLLGVLYCQMQQLDAGIAAYQQAVQAHPGLASGHQNLALALHLVGRTEEAIAHIKQALRIEPKSAEGQAFLGKLLLAQNNWDEAVLRLQQAVALQPTADLHYILGRTLEEQGRTEKAIAQYQLTLQLQPDHAEALWKSHLILPLLYDLPEHILPHRQRFCRQLNHLIRQTDLTTPEGRALALRGLNCHTNFYLAYQGFNDRGLQRKYGNFVHRIMAANFLDWATQRIGRPQTAAPLAPRKLRIGYLSAHMMAHSAAAWVRGWLRHCDRTRFEIYTYHISQPVDFITQELRDLSDTFRYLPKPVAEIGQQVVDDQLDILVFTDIGMDPKTTQLAALRLAPVQCTAWGHPVTSGLPTVDYYLSSDLMEPESAQQHYTEKLIRLPHIGISYPKPPPPEGDRPRSHFGLRTDAVIYLSFQSPFKYLPQFDSLFAEIAQRVPQAQFVFLKHSSTHGVRQFRQRLERAFAAVGLVAAEFCIFLNKLDRLSFWGLNQVSDVALDTPAWSGGNSTLEAVAYGLPVVTYPGEFMRGRHSAAILQRLGVTQTIAQSAENYVEIATRLGLDLAWRRSISEQLLAGAEHLYDDVDCVRSLENFYIQVASNTTRTR